MALTSIIYLRQFCAKENIPSAGPVTFRCLSHFCPQLGFLGRPMVNLTANKIVELVNNCRDDRRFTEPFFQTIEARWPGPGINPLEIIPRIGYANNYLIGYE